MFIKSLYTIVAILFSHAAFAQDYYVSPTGSDTANGLSLQASSSTVGPFKTLARAQQAIRSLKTSGQLTQPVIVHIQAGTYTLTSPLSFDQRDSGFADSPIQWQGEPGANVIVSGGIAINCAKTKTTTWLCPLTSLPSSASYFDTSRIKGNGPKFEFYVNDQRLELARWPDSGWAHIKLPLNQNNQFSVMETMPKLSGSMTNAQVHIFAGNDWYDQYLGVSTLNSTAKSIKLSTTTAYPLASGRRFYIQNLPALLNAPGEWIYDTTTKKISFIPPTGVSPSAYVVSSLPNLLIADGLSYVTFNNLSFKHSTGHAILLKKTSNITLDQVNINNVGGKGLYVTNSNYVQLTNSTIHHTGADGIDINGGDRNTLQSSGHEISNNYLHHTSNTLLTYAPAISLSGVGIQVSHNLLEQGGGAGIQITGNDHFLEKNEIHHYCLQALDCGAIYSGRDWSYRGNVIRYNSIHDIIGYGLQSFNLAKNTVSYVSPFGARGIYLDDAVSSFNVTGNLFNNAGQIALQLAGGRDNNIDNNVFITDGYAIWVDNRWSTYDWSQNDKKLTQVPYQSGIWRSKYPQLAKTMNNKTWPEGNSIQRNIIVSNKADGLALRYLIPSNSNTIAHNLVWGNNGQIRADYNILDTAKSANAAPWQQWLAVGIEQESIYANPCVSVSGNVVSFCSNSPANQIGFTALPTDMGLLK